jgi:hypothetical protein
MGICPKAPKTKLDLWGTLEKSPISYPYSGEAYTPFNEPVSMSDCVKWPNSPICTGGATFFDPCGVIPGPFPDELEKRCSSDGCECCTYTSYRLLGFPTPPVIRCERKDTPECKPGAPPKPFDPSGLPPIPSPVPIPPMPGLNAPCREWLAYARAKEIEKERNGLEHLIGLIKGYHSINPRKKYTIESPPIKGIYGDFIRIDKGVWYDRTGSLDFGTNDWAGPLYDPNNPQSYNPFEHTKGRISLKLARAWNLYEDGQLKDDPYVTLLGFPIYEFSCSQGDVEDSAPPYAPDEEDDMACCEETNDRLQETNDRLAEILKRLGNPSAYAIPQSVAGELIKTPTITEIAYELPRLIAERLGTGQFPVEIPTTLLSDDDKAKSIKLESLTEFVGWFVQQVDALVGQFPVKIDLEDADAQKEGDQKQTIVLPNLAEAIAEIYGVAFQSTYNSSLVVDLVLRHIGESIKNGNMAVETLDYAKAIVKHMGFKGNKVERKVPYFVDPRETADMDKYRKEVELYTQGYEYEDKQTMAAQMQMLVYVAAMLKTIHLNEWNPKKQHEDGKKVREDSKTSDTAWDKYISNLNDPNSVLRSSDDSKNRIKDIRKGKI